MIPKTYEPPLRRFFDFIHGNIEKGQWIEVRAFDPYTQVLWAGDPKSLVSALLVQPGIRNSVYFGVLPRKTRFGKKEDVADNGWFLWADLDMKQGSTFGDLVEAALPAPCAIVGSGHGWHAYWKLREPAPKDAIEWANRNIAALIGSDNVSDASRIMRVPYTINKKSSDKEILADVIRLEDTCDGHYYTSFLLSPNEKIKARATRIKKISVMPEGHMSRSEKLFAIAVRHVITGRRDMDALESEMLAVPEGSKLLEMSPGRRKQWIDLTYKNARKTILTPRKI